MRVYKLKNTDAHLLTISNTAQSVDNLIRTAGSYNSSDKLPAVDTIVMYVKSGSVRFLFGNKPTSDIGFEVKTGSFATISGINLKELYLIRTSTSDAEVVIEVGQKTGGETTAISSRNDVNDLDILDDLYVGGDIILNGGNGQSFQLGEGDYILMNTDTFIATYANGSTGIVFPSKATMLINASGNQIINVDSNNNSTNAYFAVARDSMSTGGTQLFKVYEDGKIEAHANTTDGGCITEMNTITTTDATQVDLISVPLNEGDLVYIEAEILATDSSEVDEGISKVQGVFYRKTGGDVTKKNDNSIWTDLPAGWSVDFEADTVNQTADLRVTGAGGVTITWKAKISYTVLTY